MTRADEYRAALAAAGDWDAFLMEHSGLPGPRGNIELGLVAADLAPADRLRDWRRWDAARAPVGSPREFLAFCGVLGLGRLAVEGDGEALAELRRCATDGRWRVREAVAMALQRVGAADFDRLAREMTVWSTCGPLVQRAAAAALCEPRLLTTSDRVARALRILDEITSSMTRSQDRRREEFRALRKGLGYCWSVAVAADPEPGKAAMERWIPTDDADVRWVMRSNLGKKRLVRMDAGWVTRQRALLGTSPP